MKDITLEDIILWADGVIGAVHTPDLCHKIKQEEMIIASTILKAKKENDIDST